MDAQVLRQMNKFVVRRYSRILVRANTGADGISDSLPEQSLGLPHLLQGIGQVEMLLPQI